MPQLHFEESGRALFVYVLRPGRTVIGRSDRCDVALPSESVSRVHCIVEGRADGWRVLDRSRHGTRVNGQPAHDAPLADGDRLAIGDYDIRFTVGQTAHLRSPTATAPMPTRAFEALLDGDEQGVATSRASLRFTRGPWEGETRELPRHHTLVGGPGADIELDDQLPREALVLRVVRGRPMVEPASAAVFLAGARVREVTPAWFGEEVRVGQHAFELVEHAQTDDRELDSFGDMVGATSQMRRLFGALSRMAGHDSPVLLLGESGTGKELAARALHEHSACEGGPFVAVNCAAIAANLFESELFGHEKGAFTGAVSAKDGAFHLASGGTLFLDEVGEMPLELQPKLLRALESGEVRRVGAREPTFPDVRVVAATNRDLLTMTRDGTFREDLYWRLAVLTVRIPPLRERSDDVPWLARTLLARLHPEARLSDEALEALTRHPWPGNVREMRNVLTRAYVMAGPHIGAGDLAFNPWSFDETASAGLASTPEQAEETRIREALHQSDGNRTKAARLLGLPRSTLLYKMRKLGLG